LSENFDLKHHTFSSSTFTSLVDEAIAFLLSSPVSVVPPKQRFPGTGVYAIYYKGNFALYKPLLYPDSGFGDYPIYVGKAVPPGWRQGRGSKEAKLSETLFTRLREHAGSISQTENLNAADFYCRFMILNNAESDLIGAVEAGLIRKFRPIWNSIVDGFGNHDPGSGRYEQAVSEWDTLHPGRSWSLKLKGKATQLIYIEEKIIKYWETEKPKT
jgi:hypothetical protein